MDVKINDFDVVRDGTLVVNSSHTISFMIEDLTLKFDFIKDDSKEKKVRQEHQDANTLIIHIYNFDNTVGSGFSDPIEIARFDTNEILYVLFAVYSIADNLKIFHYTWLKGPAMKEGGNYE